jgi:hypothetical protein
MKLINILESSFPEECLILDQIKYLNEIGLPGLSKYKLKQFLIKFPGEPLTSEKSLKFSNFKNNKERDDFNHQIMKYKLFYRLPKDFQTLYHNWYCKTLSKVSVSEYSIEKCYNIADTFIKHHPELEGVYIIEYHTRGHILFCYRDNLWEVYNDSSNLKAQYEISKLIGEDNAVKSYWNLVRRNK